MKVEVINCSPTLPLPQYKTEGSAGCDLMACFDNKEKLEVKIWKKDRSC